MLIVMRALHGLKSAGESWRSLLAEVCVNIHFQLMKADRTSGSTAQYVMMI